MTIYQRGLGDIFLMHRLEGMKYRQIAAGLGISHSAVEKHIAKAALFFGRLDERLVGMPKAGEGLGDNADARAEAAAWLARLHSDARVPADERGFRAWLGANQVNADAFNHLTNVWNISGGLTVTAGDAVLRPRKALISRRQMLGGGAGLGVVSATLGIWEVAWSGVYETRVGEQRHVALSDGSQVFLDTDTRIRERFGPGLRTVTLYRGRANFRSSPDLARPFLVKAGDRRLVTQQATFDVRLEGDKVTVLLLQGDASIGAARPGGGPRIDPQPAVGTLTSGARLVSTPDAAPTVDRPDVAPLVAWQTGQAVFDDETLADAVAEMNRYSTDKLHVADPSVGGLRISGVYRVGDNAAFARSIAALLPIRLEVAADGIALFQSQDGNRQSPD